MLYWQLDTYLPASNDSAVLVKRQEDLRVILFLKALGPEYSSLRQLITSQSSLPTVDEVFFQALRLTPVEKISTTALETSAMMSHGSSGHGARGRGRGFAQSRGRVGRDGGINARGASSSDCNHCQRARHTEAYCYTLHPELRPTLVAYAVVEDSSSPAPPDSTNVRNTGDTITLTRAKYDAWVRSQQVTGSSTRTATLAQTSNGSSSLYFL